MVTLRDKLKPVMHKHRNLLIPYKNSQNVAFQAEMEELTRGIPSAEHVTLGDFYEYVSGCLWGGRLRNTLLVPTSSEDYLEGDPVSVKLTKPDVINHRDREYGESKAIRSGSTCSLLNDQMARYRLLQSEFEDYQFYLAFYRHGVKGIKKFEGSKKDLYKKLSEETYLSAVLPLSIIFKLHDPETTNMDLVRIYRANHNSNPESHSYPSCTVLQSTTMNGFVLNPEKMIENLEMDPNDFKIKRYSSPRDLKIGGFKIDQFPIVRIYDKDHKKWMKDGFNSTHKGGEALFEQKFIQEEYQDHLFKFEENKAIRDESSGNLDKNTDFDPSKF